MSQNLYLCQQGGVDTNVVQICSAILLHSELGEYKSIPFSPDMMF